MEIRKKLVAVVGATGSGKTATAVELAKKYNGVLISADSRQVYRGLNIGTNKEGNNCQWQNQAAVCVDKVPQLLIDIVNPEAKYTLADWLTETKKILEEIWQQGQLPIIVGGTGLYVSALLDGYVIGGGRHSKRRESVDFESLLIYLDVPREQLYEKSDRRFEKIFDELLLESKKLIANGVSIDWLYHIGLDYRFAAQYLLGRMNREIAISEFQRASRAYIRRQLTWWRHHGELHKCRNVEEAIEQVDLFLNDREKNVK